MLTPLFLATLAIATIGGIVRGASGFGGAMIMTPILAWLLGPQPAIVIVLSLEGLVAAPMLPAAFRIANARLLLPISLTACVVVPLGGIVLVSFEADVLRRIIAATVFGFTLLMMSGFRYAGRQRMGTSIALGALSGVLVGATGVGGPPVIIYLLSGPDSAAVTRANLTIYILVISVASLVMLWFRGFLDEQNATMALWLALPYYGGVWVGSHLFTRMSEATFRRWTLVFLGVVSGVILIV